MVEIIVILIALSLGSFGNNLISFYTGNSKFDLIKSFCFCGEKELRFYELIPLFTFIIQKRKCRECEKKIPYRYFLVELFSCLIGIISYLEFGLTFRFIIYFFLLYSLLLIAVIDLYVYRIPNHLVFILLLLAVINFFLWQTDILLNVITAVLITVIFLLANKLYLKTKNKLAVGFGDIKLIAALCLFFGFPLALFGLWFSSLIALPGFYLLKKTSPKFLNTEKIPFGLFISIGYGLLPFFSNYINWKEVLL